MQPKGLSTYKGKLTKEQREEILFRLSTEDISNRKIAKEYGVSHSTINALVNGVYDYGEHFVNEYQDFLKTIDELNLLRDEWLETKDKEVWKSLIIKLPESWLQTRTIDLNYEVLRNIVRQRANHKLTEWHQFIDWVHTLPYAEEFIFYDGPRLSNKTPIEEIIADTGIPNEIREAAESFLARYKERQKNLTK